MDTTKLNTKINSFQKQKAPYNLITITNTDQRDLQIYVTSAFRNEHTTDIRLDSSLVSMEHAIGLLISYLASIIESVM